MNLIKEFFYFTKLKLIVFVILSGAIVAYMTQTDQILGDYFTWSNILISVLEIYLFICILFFAFKDIKHFLIGLVIFILIIGADWISNNDYNLKRVAIWDNCLKLATTDNTVNGSKFGNCLNLAGYKLYR